MTNYSVISDIYAEIGKARGTIQDAEGPVNQDRLYTAAIVAALGDLAAAVRENTQAIKDWAETDVNGKFGR